MVWAVAIPAAIAIGSAAAQWLNSRNAQQASEAERRRIQALYDQVQDPSFDPAELTPEDYQVVGSYLPDAAEYVEEARPDLIDTTPDMARGRDAEKQALEQMLMQSRDGSDPLTEIARAKASRAASADAASSRASLDQGLQRRGVGVGSSMGYAANLQAGQDAALRSALAGEEAVANNAARRDQSLRGAADLGSRIRSSDMSMEQANANVINNFNQRLATRKQDYLNRRTDTMNDAQRYNLGVRQGTADRNVGNRNNFKVQERNRGDDIAQRQFDNSLSRVDGQSGLARDRMAGINSRTAQDNQAIQSLGDVAIKGAGSYQES
ncbi:MAG: hypothetical protein ACRDD1_12195, partial [Planctomycetia bacterium]